MRSSNFKDKTMNKANRRITSRDTVNIADWIEKLIFKCTYLGVRIIISSSVPLNRSFGRSPEIRAQIE